MEKIHMSEALLSGIYDVELKSLENKAALKLLQNQAAAKYVKLFENETEKLLATFDVYEDSEEEGEEQSDDEDEDFDALEETYISIYTLFRSMPRKCESFEELKAIKEELQLSYHDRKQELERLSNQIDIIDDDPKVKEMQAQLESATKEFDIAKKAFDHLDRDEKVLANQVDEIEKRHNETMQQKRKELDEKEKKLAEAQQFMESEEEVKLATEVAELEAKQKEINQKLRVDDDDYDSSIFGIDIEASMPPVEKVTTDLASFFKNPNDFPDLFSNMRSPAAKNTVEKKQKTPQNQPETSSSSSQSSSESKKNRTSNRHLKPKNSNVRVQQPPKKLPRNSLVSRRSTLQNVCPQAAPRQLRSGSKRKSQEPVASQLQTDDIQPPVKILRVEILAKTQENVKEPSDEIIESSEPEQVKMQPRNLSKEFHKQNENVLQSPQKFVQVSPKKAVQVSPKKAAETETPNIEKVSHPSAEDPQDPVKDGQQQQTDTVSIPETTEDEPMEPEIEIEANDDEIQEGDDYDMEEFDAHKIFNVSRTSSSMNLDDVFNISGLSGSFEDIAEIDMSDSETSVNDSFNFGDNNDAPDFFSNASPDKNVIGANDLF